MPMRKTIPLCWWCRHFDTAAYENEYAYRCAAFPQRIPAEIINIEYDHRAPHPDDDGTQFEQAEMEALLARTQFHASTPEAIRMHLVDAQFLLEMGRMRGGIQPPLDDDS